MRKMGRLPVSRKAPISDGCKPNSVGPRCRGPDGHLSRAMRLSARARQGCGKPLPRCDYYPGDNGQAAQLPVLSCTAWGFSCPVACAPGGELLPRLFTLTGVAPGGLFSVTLSVTAGFRPRPPRILHGMLPYGVRTFLQRVAPPAAIRHPKASVTRARNTSK